MTKLSSPNLKETILLYTSTSQKAVSAALVVERENDGTRKQLPVYFVSEPLAGSKLHYSELEKIAYAVIMASRQLRHYFEAHKIIAFSNQPLHDLLHNREASPRIAKWSSELSELVVDFKKRTAIKSQLLADFIVDWTSHEAREEELTESWTIHCDGSWQNEGVGIEAILKSPSREKIRYATRLTFGTSIISTNNTTEYEALLLGLRKMKALGHQNCIIKTDSKVITDHIEKESEAKKPKLIEYLEAVKAMEKHFKGFTITHIPRAQNDEADRLAKAAARKQLPPDVFFEEISTPSTRARK